MDEFKAYVEALDPNKKPISRHILSELILASRTRLTNDVCKKLSYAESVALTFDIWSARKGWRGFGCVTAHYVNTFGKMENFILHFKRMKYPRDAATIKSFIEKPIRMFKLQGRVVSITTDNASNNLAALDLMDKSVGLTSLGYDLIHYRCLAHIFDLGMRDAMKKLKELVAPVREAVMAIHSSQKRKEKFEEQQKELIAASKLKTASKQPLELIEDVEHRWNSLFALLQRAFLLREAIDYMIDTTKGMETIFPIVWDPIAVVIKFLQPFNEATKHLCQANKVNISLVAYITPKLVNHCAEYELDECDWIAKAAESMREKLSNYELGIYHNIAEVAFFLDPQFITSGLSATHTDIIIENMKKLLDKTSLPALDSLRPASDSILGLDSDESEQVDELKNYMVFGKHLGLVPMTTDVLAWWQTNTRQFPKLASLARKILPVQGTSVASERIFSVAGDIDSRKRNRLCDESVENIVLFKSWMSYRP